MAWPREDEFRRLLSAATKQMTKDGLDKIVAIGVKDMLLVRTTVTRHGKCSLHIPPSADLWPAHIPPEELKLPCVLVAHPCAGCVAVRGAVHIQSVGMHACHSSGTRTHTGAQIARL